MLTLTFRFSIALPAGQDNDGHYVVGRNNLVSIHTVGLQSRREFTLSNGQPAGHSRCRPAAAAESARRTAFPEAVNLTDPANSGGEKKRNETSRFNVRTTRSSEA